MKLTDINMLASFGLWVFDDGNETKFDETLDVRRSYALETVR